MGYCLAIIFLCSLVLTGSLRRMALARNMLDIPNHRSSHFVPTPRGGGLAFVLVFLVAVLVLQILAYLDTKIACAVLCSGILVASAGLLDDQDKISVSSRLIAYFAAAAIALYFLQGMPTITFFSWNIPAGYLLNFLAIVYLVWLINLYNFMDGIDGIASVEAISVCLAAVVIYILTGHRAAMILPTILTASVAGFLCWNFPKAKIFMGDTGSSFLGLIVGLLSIQAAWIKPELFWSWLILLAVFIVDASYTLLRRAFQGAKIFEAHRSHAYQCASRQLNSHLLVTIAVLMINVFWLFPLAYMSARGYLSGFLALMIAYCPLLLLVIQFQSEKTE